MLGACDKEVPYYQLTAEQRAWAAPYKPDTEWRFRSSRGAERAYRVQLFSDKKEKMPGPNGKPESYTDIVSATFYRPDSITKPSGLFTLAAPSGPKAVPLARVSLAMGFMELPIQAIAAQQPLPAGYELLPQLTTSTHTYSNVLHYRYTQPVVGELFYSQGQGVVRFVEKAIVWDRL